jgi:hypothetical protein
MTTFHEERHQNRFHSFVGFFYYTACVNHFYSFWFRSSDSKIRLAHTLMKITMLDIETV